MTDKYYTPELEEAHIGFECELNIKPTEEVDEWIYYKIDSYLKLRNIYESPKVDIRVKYLDKQDIEDCGFELVKKEYPWQYTNGIWKITTPIHSNNQSIPSNAIIVIYKGADEQCYFEGIIKNKSELIKILKQVGV